MALFGTQTRSSSRGTVEFRAGLMERKADNMVHPDSRKGLVKVTPDDQLVEFSWKDRTTGLVQQTHHIAAGSADFRPVRGVKGGRVYCLRFKSDSTKRHFFWMQEPNESNDGELARKVNELLSDRQSQFPHGLSGLEHILPPEVVEQLSAGAGHDNLRLTGLTGTGGLLDLLSGGASPLARPLDSRTSASSLSGARRTTTTDLDTPLPTSRSATAATGPPATAATAAGAAGRSASRPAGAATPQLPSVNELQSILSNIAPNASGTSSDTPTEAAAPKPEPVDLCSALKTEAIVPILANEDVQKCLLQHLPEGEDLPRTEKELKETIRSPQFRQALSSFSVALASGQLGPVLAHGFDLPADCIDAANRGDVDGFARSLQQHAGHVDQPDSDDQPLTDQPLTDQPDSAKPDDDQKPADATPNKPDHDKMDVDED